MQKLLFIGSNTLAQFAKLSGADALIVSDKNSWKEAFKYLNQYKSEIGGVCLGIDPNEFDIKASRKLKQLSIPTITLPLSTTAGQSDLGKIMDKALGMRIKKGEKYAKN